jgi:hypothetical protein
MKKTLKIIGISILILILFRGFIYRLLINYNEIGERAVIEITNQELINKIESKSTSREIDFEEIISIANSITIEELRFTGNRASNNPNELMNSRQANCIGYSAMFNSIANYLIKENGLSQEIESRHKISQLDLLGINLHQFFENSFFRDHDFNEIENLKTGEIMSVDPSANDYLGIKKVSSNAESK